MSFFGLGKSAAGTAGSGNAGSNSLIGSLNLDTTVPVDPTAKRKSIFEPSSTTEARSATNMFNLNSKPAGTAAPFGQSATASSSTPFAGFSLNPSTTSTQPTTAQNATTTGGGIFGNKTQIGGAAPIGSTTFGQPGTAQNNTTNTGDGLFGNKPQTGNAAPLGSTMFGLNKPATTPSTGSGLFNIAPAATTASNTGAFGSTATPKPFGLFAPTTSNAPAPANTSTFGSSFAQTNSAQQPFQASQQASQAKNREPAYFNGLLERQKKKVKLDALDQSGQLGQLPSMNLDLGDLARRAQELSQKNQKTGHHSAKESRAHYLLSGSGVDPVQAYRDFQKIDGDSAPIIPTSRVDMAEEGSAYLKGMQTKGREAMLRETMDRVYRDVDAFIEESLGIDFDEQKTRIMQHFGLIAQDDAARDPSISTGSFGQSRATSKSKAGARSLLGRSGLDKSIIGNASSIAGSSSFFAGQVTSLPTALGRNQSARDLRDRERRFMEKIEALNNARSNERNYRILREFKEVESSIPGDVPKQVVDVYTALDDITKESTSETGLRERAFLKAHIQSTSQSSTPRLRKQILEGSRKFLENAFFKDLLDLIQKHPKEAQMGGVPSAINQVRAYIRVRASKNDLAPDGVELKQIGEAGDYCWAIIFYLLRSGHVGAALSYVNNEEAFQSLDRRFVSYLMAYNTSPEGRLGRKMQEMIDGEYQQRTQVARKGTVDPYQVACYKVIGRCDLAQRSLESVGQGVEDWIWLQFALARETDHPEDVTGEIFGLEQIVETVTEIGQKHFQKGQADTANSYGTYFLMQILAGMFEQAVDYLHSFNPVSAVHLAIALSYYGLLRVSDYQTAGNELCKSRSSLTQDVNANYSSDLQHYTTGSDQFCPLDCILHNNLQNRSAYQSS